MKWRRSLWLKKESSPRLHEKYTVAHSNHVGLKFVALKWQNLTEKIDVGETSSEDYNYRSNEERHSGRR